jgi:hypothetical protein
LSLRGTAAWAHLGRRRHTVNSTAPVSITIFLHSR